MSTELLYFLSRQTTPPLLLRRADFVDEAFREGAWRPTKVIVEYMFGNDDFVEPISEAQARELAPAAFAVAQAS